MNMKIKIILLVFISIFLFEGCTPSMNLYVNYPTLETSDSNLQLRFEFERKGKPLDLRRVWIYKDDLLVLELGKSGFSNYIQSIWDFPSIPKGFKITFPENSNEMPPLRKEDNLRFEILAGGSYSTYKYRPKS